MRLKSYFSLIFLNLCLIILNALAISLITRAQKYFWHQVCDGYSNFPFISSVTNFLQLDLWLANPLIASGENHVSSKLIMRKEKIPVYYFRSFFLRAVALLKYAQISPPAEISRLSKKGKQFFSLAAFAGDGEKGGRGIQVFFSFLFLFFQSGYARVAPLWKINWALLSIEVPGRFAAAIKRAVYVLCSSVRSRQSVLHPLHSHLCPIKLE